MADYSAIKSYVETPLSYLLSKFRKVYKGSNPSPSPDTPAELISNIFHDLSFNVFNVREMTATQTVPNGHTHVYSLPLFHVTLTRNIKSQEIFTLNSLKNIIIKVELHRTQTGHT
jgi:hypothetical protein